MPSFMEFMIEWLDAFKYFGCDSFSKTNALGFEMYYYKQDPCRALGTGGWALEVKPFSYFCPVSCGCRGGDEHCPDTCPVNATHWWDRDG